MTPPQAPRVGDTAETPGKPAAVSVSPSQKLETLRKRADFLAAARATYRSMPSLVVQARKRSDTGPARVGFTCSKKLGNAVTRNRAKRRLREVARLSLAPNARPGWDYVLIGKRQKTIDAPFANLQSDLLRALKDLHNTP